MNSEMQYKNNSKKPLIWLRSLCINMTVGTLLSLLFSISYTQASSHSTEIALADLLKDIEKINNELNVEKEVTAISDGFYVIVRGDTLDQIIDRVVPKTSLRKAILRQAIVRANPHAFKRSNPNWMYANKRIKLPDADDIKRVIFASAPGEKKQAKNYEDKKDWIRYP